MAGPAIPYLTLPEIPLSFLQYLPIIGDRIDPGSPPTIKPFGTLVALGVYLGSVIALRHAKERGLDQKKLNDFIFYSIGSGFVGAHVLDAIFYYPHKVAANPLYLLELWAGLSSFGGFTGALIGSFIWKWKNRESSVLAQIDVVCSAFPLAWVFGRAGCSVAHDHPGLISDSFLAVQYPNLPPGLGRFDLGLIECVLTMPLALAFYLLWRRGPRYYGFYAGWMSILYAPVRFGLDFLRVGPGDKLPADERYFGLTPAQIAAIGLVFLGLYVVRFGKRNAGYVPATYDEAQSIFAREAALAAGDDEEEDEPVEEEAPAPSAAKPRKKKKAVAAAATADEEAPARRRRRRRADKDASAASPRKEPTGTEGDGAAGGEAAPGSDPRPEAAVDPEKDAS